MRRSSNGHGRHRKITGKFQQSYNVPRLFCKAITRKREEDREGKISRPSRNIASINLSLNPANTVEFEG